MERRNILPMPAEIRGTVSGGSEDIERGFIYGKRGGRGGGAQTYLLRQMINADDDGGVAVPFLSPDVSFVALFFLLLFELDILTESNGSFFSFSFLLSFSSSFLPR